MAKRKRFVYYQTMTAQLDLSRLARTVGGPTRIRMLTLLMDGRAATAKELAYGTGVDPATATFHLRRLTEDGLLESTTQGRFKYFRFASPDAAKVLESLMVMAQPAPAAARGDEHDPIRVARFCYDHLAGRLGTHLTKTLIARRWLLAAQKDLTPTPTGEAELGRFGVDVAALRRGRRALAYRCLDWSERQDHLAGALGAALAERMIALGWIARKPDSRVVRITEPGRRGLARRFGVSVGQ